MRKENNQNWKQFCKTFFICDALWNFQLTELVHLIDEIISTINKELLQITESAVFNNQQKFS